MPTPINLCSKTKNAYLECDTYVSPLKTGARDEVLEKLSNLKNKLMVCNQKHDELVKDVKRCPHFDHVDQKTTNSDLDRAQITSKND